MLVIRNLCHVLCFNVSMKINVFKGSYWKVRQVLWQWKWCISSSSNREQFCNWIWIVCEKTLVTRVPNRFCFGNCIYCCWYMTAEPNYNTVKLSWHILTIYTISYMAYFSFTEITDSITMARVLYVLCQCIVTQHMHKITSIETATVSYGINNITHLKIDAFLGTMRVCNLRNQSINQQGLKNYAGWCVGWKPLSE